MFIIPVLEILYFYFIFSGTCTTILLSQSRSWVRSNTKPVAMCHLYCHIQTYSNKITCHDMSPSCGPPFSSGERIALRLLTESGLWNWFVVLWYYHSCYFIQRLRVMHKSRINVQKPRWHVRISKRMCIPGRDWRKEIKYSYAISEVKEK